MEYFFLLGAVMLMAIFSRKFPVNFSPFLIFILLVLFAGLRDSSVGTDTNNYVGMFNFFDYEKNIFQIDTSIEVGYMLLMKFANFFTEQYWFLLTIIAAIVVFSYLYAINNLSVHIPISIFVFFVLGTYLFFFNGARQGLAAAIFSLSIIAIKNSKKGVFYFLVFIAVLFHKTAIIGLPVYYLVKRKFNLNYLIILTVGVAVAIILMNSMDSFLPEDMSSRYGEYLTRGKLGAGLLTLYYLTSTLYLMLMRRFIIKESKPTYDIYLNLCIISALIYSLVWVMRMDVNLVRLSIYFSLGYILIWPMVFKIRGINNNIIYFLLFVVGHLSFFYIYISKMGDYLPFSFNSSLL